ncbi:MAG: beta-galactosidase, partial [Actinobacteria bacterium]|nr:beta-galactosidase [Actinomycetota bacterium]
MYKKITVIILALVMAIMAIGCFNKAPKKVVKKKPKKVTTNVKPTFENTFYIMPNYEIQSDYNLDLKNIREMKSRIGIGGRFAKTGFMGVVRYMNETKGKAGDYVFDPTLLNKVLQLSIDTNMPVSIALNGGPWGDVVHNPKTDLIEFLEQDKRNVQWKDDGTVPDDDSGPLPGLNRILTYNHINQTVRKYHKRNFQAAVKIIADFANRRPDLFVGITTDPEIFMNPFYYSDYNPDTIKEFIDYEKEKYKDDIKAFNDEMGTKFANWNKIDPPRPTKESKLPKDKRIAVGGNKFWEEWTDFRIYLVKSYVQDEVNWAREAGLPASRIFTHQTVRTDNPAWMRYMLASTMDTAKVEEGSIGITALQDLALDKKLFA